MRRRSPSRRRHPRKGVKAVAARPRRPVPRLSAQSPAGGRSPSSSRRSSRRTHRCRRAPRRRRPSRPQAHAAPVASRTAPAGATVVMPAVQSHQRADEPVLRIVWLPPRRRRSPAEGRCASAGGAPWRRRQRHPHRAPRRRQRSGHVRAPRGTVTVGRETGSIFAGDSYLSRATPRSSSGARAAHGEGRGLAQRRLQEARARRAARAPPERHLPHRAGDYQLRAAHVAGPCGRTASSTSARRRRATSVASRWSSAAM